MRGTREGGEAQGERRDDAIGMINYWADFNSINSNNAERKKTHTCKRFLRKP